MPLPPLCFWYLHFFFIPILCRSLPTILLRESHKNNSSFNGVFIAQGLIYSFQEHPFLAGIFCPGSRKISYGDQRMCHFLLPLGCYKLIERIPGTTIKHRSNVESLSGFIVRELEGVSFLWSPMLQLLQSFSYYILIFLVFSCIFSQ